MEIHGYTYWYRILVSFQAKPLFKTTARLLR